MSLLSHSPIERARKSHARILQSVQEPGSQVAIAKTLGTSESTVSRIKNQMLEDVLAFLYCAGWKVVQSDRVCVDPGALDFMRRTTSRVMSQSELAAQLWEEDE